MKTHEKKYQTGFTILEFIVALVVAAIVASMVYTYFGNALTQSSVPIARLQKASNLYQVMENIITDYNRMNQINLRYKWRHSHAYQVGEVVLPTDLFNDNINSKILNNGRYYICTVSGTSGISTITWPVTENPGMTTGGSVTEGTVTWRELGYVWKAGTAYPANSVIVPAINNGHFYRGGGTSGATDPDDGANEWTTAAGGTQSDGSLTWTEVGTILKSNVLTENLITFLSTPARYGTGYTVVSAGTKFIKFNGTSEADAVIGTDEENILKVTIKNNDSSETLSQIFTIR
jgi:prepilin-type N-terminal cleavage/methylation domain-containing protein